MLLKRAVSLNRFKHVRWNTTAVKPEEAATVEKKQTLKEKWKLFWVNLYRDYVEVGKDVVTEARQKPAKAVTIASTLCLAYYMHKTNPDYKSFVDDVTRFNNDIILVSERLQNPTSKAHLKFVYDCMNHGLLRRLNLGVVSLMWVDNYSEECSLYQCTCSYLKPEINTFADRVIDIGFCNKWWILNDKFVDYDVNF